VRNAHSDVAYVLQAALVAGTQRDDGDGEGHAALGRRAQAAELARSGMALGIAGLFIEAHPNPEEAKCDGPCALPLGQLEAYLAQMKAVDDLVKSMPKLNID